MQKLKLKATTLRNLNIRELKLARGGYPRTYVPNTDLCPVESDDCCPTYDLCGAQ